jgi:hypothetical protein
MSKKTYSQYQKIIREGAWKKFSNKHGILDICISLVVSILVGIVWWKIFGGSESLIIALAVLVLFLLIYSIFYLGFFHKEHVFVYNRQEDKIRRFDKSLKSKAIRTTEIKITPREEIPHSDENGYYYAYLEISNGEENDLLDCYANLTVLKISYSDTEWGDYLDWVKGNTTELTWPKFDTAKDEKKVRRKNIERVNIAKWKVGGYPIFIFADGREEPMPAEHIYIEISINGEMHKNGRIGSIEEIPFCGFLKRKQGFYTDEGATTTTIINGERHKQTEPSKEIPYYRFYIEPGELKN